VPKSPYEISTIKRTEKRLEKLELFTHEKKKNDK